MNVKLVIVLTIAAFTGASSTIAAPLLNCDSDHVYRYPQRSSPATLRATFDEDAGVLRDLSLTYHIASEDSNTEASKVKMDKNYKPRSPLFKDHQRYTFDSTFCVFHLLVPQAAVGTDTTEFNVFLQQTCEDGSGKTNRLSCTLFDE